MKYVYIGRRARFAKEECPLCNNPGCGMVLKAIEVSNYFIPKQWICSRCFRKESVVFEKKVD